jgi:hypothetical protein
MLGYQPLSPLLVFAHLSRLSRLLRTRQLLIRIFQAYFLYPQTDLNLIVRVGIKYLMNRHSTLAKERITVLGVTAIQAVLNIG